MTSGRQGLECESRRFSVEGKCLVEVFVGKSLSARVVWRGGPGSAESGEPFPQESRLQEMRSFLRSRDTQGPGAPGDGQSQRSAYR